MPYYSYSQTILGSQTFIEGNPASYAFGLNNGDTWSWSGSTFTHTVYEADPTATRYNGDVTNEQIDPTRAVGGTAEQSTNIGGTQVAIQYDWSFIVEDSFGNQYEIAVLDADLNGNFFISGSENGYYLVFVNGIPPSGVNLTVVDGFADNQDYRPHWGDPVCFTAGTNITTATGEVVVENLNVGDMVKTKDHGMQPIRWIGKQTIKADGDFAPIRFSKGSIGNEHDLLVSPQHRMLISGWKAELMFGKPEVLVAAKHLVNGDTIHVQKSDTVEYFHILFDTHEIVFAEGAPSESFHPGEVGMKTIDQAARDEIFAIFPELRDDLKTYGGTAYPALKAYEARALK